MKFHLRSDGTVYIGRRRKTLEWDHRVVSLVWLIKYAALCGKHR